MTIHSSWTIDREQYKEAMAESLDKALKEGMMASDRLSWVDRPASVSEIDKWLEQANATVSNLLRERRRALSRGRL